MGDGGWGEEGRRGRERKGERKKCDIWRPSPRAINIAVLATAVVVVVVAVVVAVVAVVAVVVGGGGGGGGGGSALADASSR